VGRVKEHAVSLADTARTMFCSVDN
jgi:hypothetical protein